MRVHNLSIETWDNAISLQIGALAKNRMNSKPPGQGAQAAMTEADEGTPNISTRIQFAELMSF